MTDRIGSRMEDRVRKGREKKGDETEKREESQHSLSSGGGAHTCDTAVLTGLSMYSIAYCEFQVTWLL